ncbi:hypothetical protein [Chlamydiifrater volucris]|uniref:hypothetical protein n=1 Tax=Chlamydiifrater volucris TaxID=2681470 RepID=UPI0032B2EE78
MTLPIGSPHLSPISSIESPTSSRGSQQDRIKDLSSLIQELLRFSTGSSSSSAIQSKEDVLLSLYSIDSIESISEQLFSVIQSTSASCSKIAKALIASNISLDNKLASNQRLTPEELSLISSSLSGDGSSPGISEKRKISEETDLEEQKKLPLKKRKIFFGLHSSLLPETEESHIHSSKPTPICSLEMVREFIKTAREECIREPISFPCHKHEIDKCLMCQPTFLYNQPVPNETELLLKRQLYILTEHSDVETIAQAIFTTESLLECFLDRKYFRNHQLAVLLEKGNVGNSICISNLPNPKLHLALYTPMSSLVEQGLKNTFIQNILKLWSTSTEIVTPMTTLDILAESGAIESLDTSTLEKRIPKVIRTYVNVSKKTGDTSHVKRQMSSTFSSFLSSVIFKTIQNILMDSSYHFLLEETSSGQKLPSFELLMRICSLILGSSFKWKTRPLPCKASVKLMDHLEFDAETTQKINESLVRFIRQNKIKLKGSRDF